MHGPGDQTNDPHATPVHSVEVRFYEELNDFLPPEKRKRAFRHSFTGKPSIKDTVEALGVPHCEIDLILVNGRSVGFDHPLAGGERVTVYPTFERLDVTPLTRLRPRPLRESRFVLDVHLGALARYLRLLGFDTFWRNDLDDEAIIDIAAEERRIILTRDRGMLKHGRVTHGYWLRSTEPLAQLDEVVRAFDLARSMRPFTRCMRCNGTLRRIRPHEAAGEVPPKVLAEGLPLTRCERCGRVYWPGSHQAALDEIVRRAGSALRGSDRA